ncbi:MAG: methyltransferase domain-containing protein [Polyangiaceae bacterium]
MSEQTAAEYSFLVGFDGEWRDTWWNADFLSLMAKRWRLADVQRVLDIGCGVGHWGRTLLPHMPDTTTIDGVDREASFAERASAKAAELGLAGRARYRHATIESLPFDDGTFDFVTCQTVLMHVADVPTALAEIRRVLKPGGLFAACEPDNLAEAMTSHRGFPGTPWKDVLQLLDFQHTCYEGKRALGRGDSSIGDTLPGLLAEAGFTDLSVYQSDKCPWLVPPYQTRDQAIDLRQILEWIDAGICIFGHGSRAETEEVYLAGGGDPARFGPLFDLALESQQRWKAAVVAGKYHGGRAVTAYLVSGRKPA